MWIWKGVEIGWCTSRTIGGQKEGRKIYWTFEEKNVPNIPRFYYGNDVCYEIPRTISLRK